MLIRQRDPNDLNLILDYGGLDSMVNVNGLMPLT